MALRISSKELTKETGEVVVTVYNGRGNWYTYVIKRGSDDYRPVWFVSLLSGIKRIHVGVLNRLTGGIWLARASNFTIKSTPYWVGDWVLKLLWSDKPLPEGYDITTLHRF